MGTWMTSGGRMALATLAASPLIAMASLAEARVAPGAGAVRAGDAQDWGTILPNAGCAQSHAWIGRLRGLFGVIDQKVFEVHSPAMKDAPEQRNLGRDVIGLPGLGVASAFFDRALTNRLPGNPGEPDVVESECAAYAEAGGGAIDAGLPFISNPVPGKPQLSPIGFHIEGAVVEARSEEGHPVSLKGGAGAGYISSFGGKIIDIPKLWPVNFGLRIPPDYNQPALALATTNEQVTTKPDGTPTLDSKGQYFFDKTATSGYTNIAHASLLGSTAADITLVHAAVAREGTSAEAPPCAVPPGQGARCARP